MLCNQQTSIEEIDKKLTRIKRINLYIFLSIWGLILSVLLLFLIFALFDVNSAIFSLKSLTNLIIKGFLFYFIANFINNLFFSCYSIKIRKYGLCKHYFYQGLKLLIIISLCYLNIKSNNSLNGENSKLFNFLNLCFFLEILICFLIITSSGWSIKEKDQNKESLKIAIKENKINFEDKFIYINFRKFEVDNSPSSEVICLSSELNYYFYIDKKTSNVL